MFIESFWAIVAAAMFSSMAACVKYCNGLFGPLELVFYRSVITALFVFSVCVLQKKTLKTKHPFGHLKRDILGFASVTIWFFTLGTLPLGTNITLTYSTPLFLAVNFILLAYLRHRSPPWGPVGSICLGFIGIILLVRPSFSNTELIACAACLGVALIDLFGYWQVRFLGQKGEPSWRIVFYFSLFSAIGSGFGVVLFESGFHVVSLSAFMPVILMGLLATLGMLASTRAWSKGNMLLSACFGFSAIPFSELIGIFFFHNTPDIYSLTGMLFVGVAGMLATIFTKKEEMRLNSKSTNN